MRGDCRVCGRRLRRAGQRPDRLRGGDGMFDLRRDILVGYAPRFAAGLRMTLQLTVVAISGGLLLGMVSGLIGSSADAPRPASALSATLWKVLRIVTRGHVGFFRGTPLFVQSLRVHFALMPVLVHPDGALLLSGRAAREFRQNHGAFFSGTRALTLNAGASISEVLRAGIQRIHGGADPGRPQHRSHTPPGDALRGAPASLAPDGSGLLNETVMLVKDASPVWAIDLTEPALAARTVAGAHSRYWEPCLLISAIYRVITAVLCAPAKRQEALAHLRGRRRRACPVPSSSTRVDDFPSA